MIIPDGEPAKTDFVKWVLDTCSDSLRDRQNLYERRRRYMLFGSADGEEVLYNRLESHLDLVASFLYSPDHATYNIAADLNAAPTLSRQVSALQDEWNDEFRDLGFADLFGDALFWSLTYDTMLLKSGWNNVRKEAFATMVAPENFGVFIESNPDLESQDAFAHWYYISYDQAVQRLVRAGKADLIPRLAISNTPYESPFPELINRLIITATGGENLSGNVMGAVNPTYEARANYRAKVNQPLVKFNEIYIWDDANEDYRIFFMVDPGILCSDSLEVVDALIKADKFKGVEHQEEFYSTKTNLFLPKDHPFTVVRPHGIYDFFWGKAHIDALIPLQNWSTERLEQIHDILEKQAYPPRVGSGMMGLTDEKMEAFGGADSWVYDQLPGAKIEELRPQMPDDVFADFKEIGEIFMEASGLTAVVAGKGEGGVRSRGHAKQLATTGSGRIKKMAVRLEEPLVRFGDLNIKLKMKNDCEPLEMDPITPDGKPEAFLPAQLAGDFSMRIAGHSHSPLFVDDTRELAALLFKAKAIDREMLIRLLNPPDKNNMIRSLRARVLAEAKALATRPPPPPGKKPAAQKEA